MYDTIKWLHVEPTTRCNAWCPSCPRSNNGHGLSEFVLEDLDPDRLKKVMDTLPSLTTIQFNGNLGDPCASKLINEQLEIVQNSNLELMIHTNGSLRSEAWWNDLAKQFGKKLTVVFGIDGLEDTHHIYRQATNWKKIIANAKSFINAGGDAIWQFIPFAHNEHQIKKCMQLSTTLGFRKFEFIKDAIYPDAPLHYKTGKVLNISPWSKHDVQWNRKGDILNKKTGGNVSKKIVEKKNCMHLALSSLFLNASGVIAPCCYFKQTPFLQGQIEDSITSKKFIKTCLNHCGS